MGSSASSELPPPRTRAAETAVAISRRLYDPRRRRFGDRRFLGLRKWEALWPVTDAWRAMLTLAPISSTGAGIPTEVFLEVLSWYRRRKDDDLSGDAPLGFAARGRRLFGSPSRFYDDNSWLALALLQAHESERRGDCLELARRVMGFVVSGWTEGGGDYPGGLRWNDGAGGTTRNTCTNGPATEAAVLLYETTGDRQWLDWALRIYDWARSALLRPDSLYADHRGPGDAVDETIWSYNQGTMIGAGVLLNRVTGSTGYLGDALETARAATTRFDARALLSQPAPFNAVYFANLRLLARARPEISADDVMRTYAESVWRTRRGADGLMAEPDVSPLNASAAMVAVDALLAGAEAHP